MTVRGIALCSSCWQRHVFEESRMETILNQLLRAHLSRDTWTHIVEGGITLGPSFTVGHSRFYIEPDVKEYASLIGATDNVVIPDEYSNPWREVCFHSFTSNN